jgi:putative tryptophan/tyrosine transport system substrate-binding protein
VPHTLLLEQVDVRVTSRVIEVFHRAMRVAVHQRRYQGSRAGTLARFPNLIEALQTGLRELGYVEGKNLKIEYRFGGDELQTLGKLAAELVALGPDAIITVATPPVIATKRATTTIPIVMALAADPVRSGIVASLAHPGSNITGVTMYASELSGKRVEVLKEAVLGLARLAVLGNRTNPISQYTWEETREASRALAIEPQLFMVREPGELDTAFGAMQRSGANAVVVLSDAIFYSARRQISVLAAGHHLPVVYATREYAEDGGLISYGPNFIEMTRRSAALVDKVLKGTKPADLPIEQPTKFELVINLKTAKALGLTIPASLLARADEVIE